MSNLYKFSRRNFIQTTTTAAFSAPFFNCGKTGVSKPITRPFGKLDLEVTTLGLGGQASIQWTPEGIDPTAIIHKAFEKKINYYDTSNLYGPSQLNYGKAFRELDLIPGKSGYNEALRKSIFLTSKTRIRWGKGGYEYKGVRNGTNGPEGSLAIDDVKRSLSQIYGDGKGNYPKGAYLDMVLIHSIRRLEELDVLFMGLDNTSPTEEHIGALAALRDVRDGTNLTGMNPKEEKLIRHIGFSGHYSAPVMMEFIRRDKDNILDGMLVAINSNDRLYMNMRHNVIPVAEAKNMGVIAMKVFADGAMYSKGAHFSNKPEHVIRSVGTQDLPSRPLIEYSLSTPGVHTGIIGIGQIDNVDPKKCQLEQNLSAAQIAVNGLSATEREQIETLTSPIKDGKTNYFQIEEGGLSAVNDPNIEQKVVEGKRNILLSWNTAYAGNDPVKAYEIWRDNQKIAEVAHKPQTTQTPFQYKDELNNTAEIKYQIKTIDTAGNAASTEILNLKSV